ncbi:flagellin lysine-N-methylase [Pantoea sp. KPR_PJ]|uniref:flagellin lysine-N-methylase n=1 Tax=Pantoea sp. KPR_PJ TaxID=2738375 RepID=UPI003528E51C
MKEVSLLEPVFFNDFKCTGSACREHCCKGWNIILDKPTVKNYLNSKHPDIRAIAKDNIIKTKKSYAHWGKIRFSQQGDCAFMDEERLCRIHSVLGASELSPTCANYPRIKKVTRYEVRQTLTLSCPEAVKNLLLNSDAMLLRERTLLRARGFSAPALNQETRFINLLCSHILLSCGPHVQQGLYGIAQLFLCLDKQENDPEKYAKTEAYALSVIHAFESGEIQTCLDNIKPDYRLQWQLLLRLLAYLRQKRAARGGATWERYADRLYAMLTDMQDEGDVHAFMQRLDRVWKENVLPWLVERPHIMRNYMQYRLYSDGFPALNTPGNLASLYFLTAEWFLVKSLLAACAEQQGAMTEDDMINIIYSYHSLTKHDRLSEQAFLDEIDKGKVNDDLSLIYLLT